MNFAVVLLIIIFTIIDAMEVIIEMNGKDDDIIECEIDTTVNQLREQLQNQAFINGNTQDYLIESNGNNLDDYTSDQNIFDDGFIDSNNPRINIQPKYNIVAIERLKKEYNINDENGCIQALNNLNADSTADDIQIIELCTRAHFLDNTFINSAIQGNEDNVKKLLKAGINVNVKVNVKNEHHQSALMVASYYGEQNIVQILLNTGKHLNINDQTDDGNTALTFAISNNNKDVIQMLLDAGAEINYQSNPPLITAAYIGFKNVVKMLLNAGANVNIRNSDGDTALIEAAKDCHADMVTILLEAGADIHMTNNNGVTALMKASSFGCEKVVPILLKANAKIDMQDVNGVTALMKAAAFNNRDVPKILLEAGADVNIKDEKGLTAIEYATNAAAVSGWSYIVKMISSYGGSSARRLLSKI